MGESSILTQQVRNLLTSGRLAHLVTINPVGSPQVTCVWLGVEGDELVTAHLGAYQKVRNVTRDPRVALSLETGRIGAGGLPEYLVVYGRARVVEGGAPELLQRLAEVYIGPLVSVIETRMSGAIRFPCVRRRYRGGFLGPIELLDRGALQDLQGPQAHHTPSRRPSA